MEDKIDDLTNDIMDSLRDYLTLEADTDIDDAVYSIIWKQVKHT